MKLKSIEIERFRAARFCRLELHPEVTVLVGDNASGKTLILDAIRLLLCPVVAEFASANKKAIKLGSISSDDVYRSAGESSSTFVENFEPVKITGTELNTNSSWSSTYDPREGVDEDGNIAGKNFPDRFHSLSQGLLIAEENPVISYYGIFRENMKIEKKPPLPSDQLIFDLRIFGHREGWKDILDARAVYADVSVWFNAAEAFDCPF